MKKFAVILAWDYKLPSAEKEIVDRLIKASSNIGIECVLANRFGFILDVDYNTTHLKIEDDSSILFALHTHFDTAKWDDTFSFFTMWNPVALLFAWNNFAYHTFTYLTYDDYLSSDSQHPISHLNYLLHKVDRNFDNSIHLFPTSNQNTLKKPDLMQSRKKLFYAGTAWEKSAGTPVRHENLFKKLEQAGVLEIYGPKLANGLEPWKGYSSYVGEIPFDGHSIFQKINECGIVLALSSLEHQKAGVMSNRIFEAAIGGAIIITERNDFTSKYFSDAVLMVDNSGDWFTTAEQIIQHCYWVKNNIEIAQQMAIKSQEICLNTFMMEAHLSNLFDKLEDRKTNLASQVYSQNQQEQIDVIVRWDKFSLQEFAQTLFQLKRQIYTNLRIIFIIDTALVQSAQNIIDQILENKFEYIIHSMKIFNSDEIRYSSLHRIATTGQMLQAAIQYIKNDYIAFIKSNDIWFSDHLTTLKRKLENSDYILSHTSLASKIIENNKVSYYDDYFYQYSVNKILEFGTRESESMIMVKKNFLISLDDSMFIYLDYFDFHFIMANALTYDNGVIFTYRKTALKTYFIDQRENPQDFPIVKYEYQSSYVKSLLQFDLAIYKEYQPIIGNTSLTEEQIHHVVKMYILQHIKNPLILIKKIIRNIFK